MNIDIQGAEQQLQNQALPFVVRVGVVTSATYTDSLVNTDQAFEVPLPDFDHYFDVKLIQNGKKISPSSKQAYLVYSDSASNIYQISGVTIELRYNIAEIDPCGEAIVAVGTVYNRRIEADFDLGQLR